MILLRNNELVNQEPGYYRVVWKYMWEKKNLPHYLSNLRNMKLLVQKDTVPSSIQGD